MDIFNVILYIAIAFSGTVFGSFFTLAVHRIPKHQDITHQRSYCPKCNHKLQFLDLIPVFSYIFLGGKCRYCKEKIRPRYLILELCSGAFFVLLAGFRSINIDKLIFIDRYWYFIVQFVICVLFACAIFIIAGIDKEYKKIPNGLIVYGFIICLFEIAYLLYWSWTTKGDLFFKHEQLMDQLIGFAIPVVVMIILSIISKITKREELPIGMGDFKYLAILGLFFGYGLLFVGLFFTMMLILAVLFYKVVAGVIEGKKDIMKDLVKTEQIPLGFYLAIPFTIILIIHPF